MRDLVSEVPIPGVVNWNVTQPTAKTKKKDSSENKQGDIN
jgi:hypothetical protein